MPTAKPNRRVTALIWSIGLLHPRTLAAHVALRSRSSNTQPEIFWVDLLLLVSRLLPVFTHLIMVFTLLLPVFRLLPAILTVLVFTFTSLLPVFRFLPEIFTVLVPVFALLLLIFTILLLVLIFLLTICTLLLPFSTLLLPIFAFFIASRAAPCSYTSPFTIVDFFRGCRNVTQFALLPLTPILIVAPAVLTVHGFPRSHLSKSRRKRSQVRDENHGSWRHDRLRVRI